MYCNSDTQYVVSQMSSTSFSCYFTRRQMSEVEVIAGYATCAFSETPPSFFVKRVAREVSPATV